MFGNTHSIPYLTNGPCSVSCDRAVGDFLEIGGQIVEPNPEFF